MSEVKPCPFCGAEPDVVHSNQYETDVAFFKHSARCPLHPSRVMGFRVLMTPDFEAWNTRYERTCHAIPREYRWAACECSACGSVLEYSDDYCKHCGRRVVRDE